MDANFLPVAVGNASYTLENILPQLMALTPQLGHYETVSNLYRQSAIGLLLMAGEPREFFSCLYKSGRAFLYFLEHAEADQKLTSRATPFFDAVACLDEEGARRIAAASPNSPDPKREYEEDFFHLRFFMDRFFGAGASLALSSMLDTWTQLAEELPDPRIELCRSILDVDQPMFDSAMNSCIAEKGAKFERQLKRDGMSPDEAAILPHVSIEVLAWIELAERAGLSVATEYPLAPSVARVFHRRLLPGADSWRSIT